MTLQIIPKDALPKWIEQLRTRYRVIGPKQEQSHTVFADIDTVEEMNLDYATTLLPPKKVLLPPCEELFHFEGNGHRNEPSLADQPTLLFGVHTCDLHAISLLDHIFGSNPADEHYLSRRNHTTLVSIECLHPCSEDAFCKDMGTLSVPDDFDLHLTDLGAAYAVVIGSDKGAALLQDVAAVRVATDDDYQRVNQVMSEKWTCFPYRLEADVTELPSLLSVSSRSQVWETLGDQCLGCGACTMVCPTCYCFDVNDAVDFSLSTGTRWRAWDSCQFSQFASVAGGHDFRAERSARQRHRFNRKYRYQTKATGMVGCVGCGRCAQACLVDIKPMEVLNKLYRQRVAVSHNRQEVKS